MSGSETSQIRVLIVAPSQAMRAGLRSLLSEDPLLSVTGQSASLAAIGVFTWRDVDVLVEVAAENGAAASINDLQASLPGSEPLPALLLLSDEFQSFSALADLPLRAWGILPIDASAEELIAAVRALNEGLVVAAPHLLTRLFVNRPPVGGTLSFEVPDQALVEPLTARETEVLQHLAQGLANKQIAALLSISEHTVKFHVSSIYSKLGAANRTEAVRIGARRGLILL
jgi:NarL family two-component system response regulator YdfI